MKKFAPFKVPGSMLLPVLLRAFEIRSSDSAYEPRYTRLYCTLRNNLSVLRPIQMSRQTGDVLCSTGLSHPGGTAESMKVIYHGEGIERAERS